MSSSPPSSKATANAKPIAKLTASLAALYPPNSILDRVIELSLRNTDLPLSAVLSAAYSQLSAAAVREGFTLEHGLIAPISPNLYHLCLGPSASDLQLAFELVQAILAASRVRTIPGSPTTKVLFAMCTSNTFPIGRPTNAAASPDANTRCTSYLTATNCGDWLRRMHSPTGSETLQDYLYRGYAGGTYVQIPRAKLEETAPVYLVIFASSQLTEFFTTLGDRFYTSPLIRQFALVIASDKPDRSKAFPGGVGIRSAALQWAAEWKNILAGPRRYRISTEAVEALGTWWTQHVGDEASNDDLLQYHMQLAKKYALLAQILIDPTGVVGPMAMSTAIAIVGRHLQDLHLARTRLASESEEQRLMRKLEHYMKEHTAATRAEIMGNVHGLKQSAKMNAALDTLMEMTFDSILYERARALRKAARAV